MMNIYRRLLFLTALSMVVAVPRLAMPMEVEDCQGCHGELSVVEKGRGSLYIDPVQYGRTSHAQVGCPSCHESVTDSHPDDKVRPSRAKCADCHDEVAKEYAASKHAENAGCTDCHNPHDVKTVEVVSWSEMNRRCKACHSAEDIMRRHESWLQQPDLHIAALPCVTCHTGSENYEITFYIQRASGGSPKGLGENLAPFEELAGATRGSKPEKLIDEDGDGSISVSELREFVGRGDKLGLRLWGMMTPAKASHRYDILENRWDCTFCHASGPGVTQTSYVAFPDGKGAYRRLPVEKGAALEAVYGTPDFYIVGATRNATLSKIGILIAAAGLLMPIGHGTLRLLTMKNRREG